MESAARIGDTRFSPPQQHVHLIRRPALANVLEEGLHRRLVLLQAPAGYGKSTLLAQWRDMLVARGVRVVWLSLDEDCAIAAEFLAAIILAAEFAGIEVGALGAAIRPSNDVRDLRFALNALLVELDRTQSPIVFILDDYHFAQNDQLDALLDVFVRRMPEGVRLVLASRSRPGLALPRLRAQGQICELGAEELRFSLDEAVDLLRPSLREEEINDLAARLEGWPIALQLAAAWARNHGGGAGLLQTFSGSVDDMGDYLATQVFAQLPDHLQIFLLETSIFDRFNSRAADAARGAKDSALLMEELRRFNVLLIPMDKARTWWRHHHLVSDFLASRRGRLGTERLKRMHEGASAWFEAEGSLLEAVRHAREAEDRKRMVALIEGAGCVRLCLGGGTSRIRALFALLTPAEIDASARLRLVESISLFQGGKSPAGERQLEQVRRMAQAASLREDEAFQSDLLVVEGMCAGYRDAVLSAANQEALEAMCARNLDTDPWFGGLLNNIGCYLDLRRGEIESARLCGQKALGYFRAALSPYGCVFMHIHLSLVAIAQERLSEASNHLQDGEELVLDHFGGNVSLLTIIRTLMAQIAYARNNVAQAGELLAETLATISTSEGWSELYASGYGTSALLWLARGDIEAAEATLAEGADLVRSKALPQTNLFVMACRANLLSRTGRLAEAGAVLAEVEVGLGTNHGANWMERDEYAIAKARLNITQGLPHIALEGLEGVLREARRQGRTRSELRAETLRVLALAAQGREEAAAQILLSIVERTRGEGERRMFIDEGPAMAERLRDLVRQRGATPISPPTLEYVADLLTGFGELTRGDEKARLLATLTPREREILGELVRGGSNKVIARAIGLNENAVKFHLKNIFRKLGVAGRGMAVAMAEKLELVS
jgi:LuxR family maltose regulon positive regulatory protein